MGSLPRTRAARGNNDVSGSITRPTYQVSELNQGLNYSNRDQSFGGNGNGMLSYAFARMVETNPLSSSNPGFMGAPSLMSEYAIFYHPRCSSVNDFFDVEGQPGAYPKFDFITGADENGNPVGKGGRELKTEHLIEHAPPFGIQTDRDGNTLTTTPYFPSDFIYTKYFQKIENNHLITLRRYPFPTYDNLTFDGGRIFKPIAQAVTYMGEATGNKIEDLTRFSGYINWEEMQADIYDVEGDERGTDETPFFDKLGSKAQNSLKFGNAFLNQGRDQTGGFAQERQERQRYATDVNYTNEVLGPVNVVDKTNIRKRGIGAVQSLSLTFEYELRSIANINPRVAMLDIICNMLALCYNNAKFWGGANRYFPQIQQFGFLGDQEAFYRGDYKTYVKSFIGQVGDGLGRGLDALKGLVSGILSGDFSGLGNVLQSGGNMIMDLQRAKSRPKVIGFRALLTGLPVGEWHLTIGNPFRPIAMIGNLIVKSFDFELGGPLGIDDFPSNLKFTIQLENGRPRDKGDIESIFNMGEGRIYYPPKGFADVGNMSASTGARIRPDDRSNVGNPSKNNDRNYLGQPIPSQKPLIQTRGGYDVEFARKLQGTLF